MVTVKGQVTKDAFVACLNRRTESGVITKSKDLGYFSLKISAQVNDELELWQIISSQQGSSTSVVVGSEDAATQE
jgi:hypothetical protein